MKRVVQFGLEDGTTILVEVGEPIPTGGVPTRDVVMRGASAAEVVEKAKQNFETALEKVKPAAAAIIAKLRGLTDAPDEVHVEFGIKLTAEAGAILASAGVESHYSVTLTWKRKEPEQK